MPMDFEALEAAIGYRFRDRSLFELALTHPSRQRTMPGFQLNNQRLEFLGDAILNTILAAELYCRNPLYREGDLTRARAALANGPRLAAMAARMGLDEALLVGTAEETSGVRQRISALEDALESVAGAVFLDSGYETARRVVLAWYGDLDAAVQEGLLEANPKGCLQEVVQPVLGNEAIRYELLAETGPEHAKHFSVVLFVKDVEIARGAGVTKQSAEAVAARAALKGKALKSLLSKHAQGMRPRQS